MSPWSGALHKAITWRTATEDPLYEFPGDFPTILIRMGAVTRPCLCSEWILGARHSGMVGSGVAILQRQSLVRRGMLLSDLPF